MPKAPGMKYKHYAPNAQVYIVKDAQWSKVADWVAQHAQQPVGVLATSAIFDSTKLMNFDNVDFISLGEDARTASHHLFDGLRTFDGNPQIKVIFAQAFDPTGIGAAYMNRLQKSAGNTYFDEIN